MSRKVFVLVLALASGTDVLAALTISESADGSFAVLRDGKVLVESAAFHCAAPKPVRIEKSFEIAPDGAKVWNRWSDEREGRFRMEVVERPDGAVEMTVFGEADGAARNRSRGLRLEVPVRVLKGKRWRALTGNGRKSIPAEGVFDTGFKSVSARWMETDGILWDFNALGPSTYAHATTFDSLNGVWHVLPSKKGRYVFSGGSSLGRASIGGHGGTKIVIREGTFDDYSKHHFFSSFRYSQRLPVGRLVSFGAPKVGPDYVPGDRTLVECGMNGQASPFSGFGWVGEPMRRTVIGHSSGAYYSHVTGTGSATYRFAGLPSGFYVATIQLGNYAGTENAFSVSVNGETLVADISLEKGMARTISRAVHVSDGSVDCTFDGAWLVSAIGIQPLLSDSEDFTIRRGFWYVKGYEPSVRYRSEDFGHPLAAATADETVAMPVPGEETSAPRRDPPMPVELPDADASSLAWTRNARLWRFMSNNASLFEFADDAAREKYVAEQSKGKGYNAVMISGMLSRHTFPDRLLKGGQAAVGKLVETFHRHGMKVIDHIDLTLLWNDDIGFRMLMERLPEVLKDKNDNLPAVQLCMNNVAFKRKVFDYLRRDIELGVDGFQLDEGEFWSHGCACKTCREKFTRETGWQFPLDETDPSVTGLDTPLARRWHEWRCKTITNWYVELRRYLKDIKPDLVLSVYTTHWGFTSSHPDRGASSDLIDLGRVHNFFGTEVMTRNVMQSSRPLLPLRKMKNILTLAYGMPVWGWYYTSNEKANYFAWAVANMCGQSSLLTDHLPDPEVPRFEVWGAGPANMRKGSENVAEVAVLFSGYSRDWNRDVGFVPNAMGLAQELEAIHVPYEFIGDMSVDARHLAKYKVLFVGSAQCLSDAEIDAIRAFAAKGERVYVTETAGTRDEIGESRAESAFAAALKTPGSNVALMPSAAPFCANEVSPPRVWSFDPDQAAETAFRAKLAEMVKGATVWTVRGVPDKVYTTLWREKDGTLALHFLNSTGTNIKPGEAMSPAAPDPAYPALTEDIVFTLPMAEDAAVTVASPDFPGERSLSAVRNGDGTATVTLPRELLKAYTVVKVREVIRAKFNAETIVPIVNAAFEDVQCGIPVGWKPSSLDVWRVTRGEGLNGSSALVWESAEPSRKRATCSQELAIEPEKEYRISAQVRTQGFQSDKGAKVVLQFFDADGKEIGGMYPHGIKASNADWCLSDDVSVTPKGTVKVRIALSVLPGSMGKVAFDEVRLEGTVRPVVSYVFSSAYRNLAKDGQVAFHAFLNLKEEQCARAEVSFVCRDASGSERRLPAKVCERFGETYASCALDVSGLAMGEQLVRCEVSGLTGVEGTSAACAFTRVAELPKRRVEIDAQGRCRVNGKPFFPIGMYSHFLSEEDAERYVEGPFNTVIVYGLSTPEHLKVLEKRGIMYLTTLKNEIPGKSHATQRGIRTEAESDAFFRERIALLKDCPNLLGWYVCDEAPLSEVAARRHLYDLYRAEDADHPCWAVMDKPASMREWVAICDVYGIDPYPVQKKRTVHSEPPVVDFCAKLNAAVCGARPFWNVPQNFNWAWYGRKDDDLFPTDAELKFFNWAHIACGANGLLGYSFSPFCMKEYAKYDAYARHWKSVCAAYEDVKRLTDVLLADPFPVTGGMVQTPVRAWQKDGKVYVLACNAKIETTDVTVALGSAGWRLGALELGDATMSVRVTAEGSVIFTLPSSGVAMACLERCAGVPASEAVSGEIPEPELKLGMAGYTFKAVKDTDTLLAKLEELGVKYLCVKDFHLPFTATDAEITAFREKCTKHGVIPYAIGPIYMKDEAKAVEAFEFARKLGVKTVVGVPYEVAPGKEDVWGPDRLESRKLCAFISTLCARYDMRYAIHNHGPSLPNLFPSAESVWRKVADLDPRMGLCLDLAHERRSGFNPAESVRRYAGRLFDIHLNNIEDAGDPEKYLATTLPKGVVDISTVCTALKSVGYDGVLSIEYAKNFNDNMADLHESVDYFRALNKEEK